jgi:hypothetical protein
MKNHPIQRLLLRPWFGYVAPMATFLMLTAVESEAADRFYPWLYGFKVCVVTGLLWYFTKPRQDIQIHWRGTILAIVVGLAIFVQWVWIDQWIPYPHLGERVGYNPLERLAGWMLPVFFAFRFLGLVVVVPVMEEIFWRSFLLRYFTDSEFTKVKMGMFSWYAFAIVAISFGLSHNEWLVALICACAYGLLLRQTKSLYTCVLAHGVTNLALGLYVVLTGSWLYW